MTATPRHGRFGIGLALALSLLHAYAIWLGLGGRAGITSPWPLAKHDHPLYFHSALVTRDFLRQSGTTAGYDPTFMAGYAKSVIFPASSTLPELVIALFGRSNPVLAYKLYVLASAAAIPWLVILAGVLWRLRGDAIAWAVGLFLAYVWTDFPIQYANFGMLPYLLAIPLGLAATASCCRYLEEGGLGRWIIAAGLCALVVLVHLTAAMVVAPAVLLAYIVAARNRLTWKRHIGIGLIPLAALVLNVFWWWPGIWLAETKGDSSFAFSHPEGVLVRLVQILVSEPPIEALLWALGLPGLVVLVRSGRVRGAALAGFAVAGFGWGYGAGATRALDFLQPGRHTFALYSALALAGGIGIAELSRLVRPSGLTGWATVGLFLLAARIVGPPLVEAAAVNLGDPLPGLTRQVDSNLAAQLARARPEPFLSSRPGPHLRWIIDQARQVVRPGERLLYEEGGFGLPGVADPFQGGRYSGLIPFFAPGVELLGGPYLHAALRTNFTQFGEGKLFDQANWGRERFTRYARLYRPSAILCWSPHARAFCQENPDLIEIRADNGVILIGRVRGFEGMAIEGRAEVRAQPGRLRVRVGPGELDGRVILRYHFAPFLRARPPVQLEPIRLEEDPVPFIGLVSPKGETTIELCPPPLWGGQK